MSDQKEELKPCPHCGMGDMLMVGEYSIVFCGHCDAEHVPHVWNHRPLEDALSARIRELEEKVRDKEAIIKTMAASIVATGTLIQKQGKALTDSDAQIKSLTEQVRVARDGFGKITMKPLDDKTPTRFIESLKFWREQACIVAHNALKRLDELAQKGAR